MFHIRLVVNHVMNNEMAKIMVGPYEAGRLNCATSNETAKNTVTPHQADTVTMNKLAKITDTIFVGYMCIIKNTDEDRLRIISLTRKMPCRTHGKEGRYTCGSRLLCSLNYIYCTPHRCSLSQSSQCTVHRHSVASALPHDAIAFVQYIVLCGQSFQFF